MNNFLGTQFRKWFQFSDFNYIQKQCLPFLLRTDENAVISAPTGSGKTTLFELSMIRALEKGLTGKIVYMAPMRALCAEKLSQWKEKFAATGHKCVEFSDETEQTDIEPADLIICTPEKLEFNSRIDKSRWIKDVQLVMIDEVHFLNCERGAVLEAVLARLRGIVSSRCRIIAVSATIPNIATVALWLRDPVTRQPARILKFPDSMRPVPLKTNVIGCYRGAKKTFDFEFGLNFRLADLINKHCDGKQTLIFCSTRQSTEKTAEILSQKLRPKNVTHVTFDNDKLNYNVGTCAVGFHHAGLSPNDRSKVEQLFRENKITVLCATSTLAVGVNLPARLVIIKSTLKYTDSGYQEYDELEVRQMIGRAGRAGLDEEGTAIILTDSKTQHIYKNISEGKMEVKSNLNRERIVDYLNVEIATQRIKTMREAHEWFDATFLSADCKTASVNMNPGSNELVEAAINDLCTAKLLQVQEHQRLIPSQMSMVVARNFISVKTFTYFRLHLNQEAADDTGCLLQVLCACPDSKSQFRLKNGTKQHMFKIANHPLLRFPLKDAKQNELTKKLFLLCQVNLQSDLIEVNEHLPSNIKAEAKEVCEHLQRLLKFVAEYFLKSEMGSAFVKALELQSAMAGEAWPDDCKLFQQVNGLGTVYSRKLFSAGIVNLNDLASCDESRLEVICARNPPFGHKIKAQIADSFPLLQLNPVMKDDSVICSGEISGQEGPIHLVVMVQLLEGPSQILLHELFQKRQTFIRTVKLPIGNISFVTCSLISTAHSGCNRHVNFTVAEPEPKPIVPAIPTPSKSTPCSEEMSGTSSATPQTTQVWTPAKRSVPSPVSAEKSVKTKHFLGNRKMTLASAQSFLQKYAPISTPPIRSSLLLPKSSVTQSLVDEIDFELK